MNTWLHCTKLWHSSTSQCQSGKLGTGSSHVQSFWLSCDVVFSFMVDVTSLFMPLFNVRSTWNRNIGHIGWKIFLSCQISANQGLKPWPCLGQKIPKMDTLFRTTPSIFITLFRTKVEMNAVLFWSQLLAIAREQIHVIVIAFVNLENKQNSSSKSNQSCGKYPVDRLTKNYTLFRT